MAGWSMTSYRSCAACCDSSKEDDVRASLKSDGSGNHTDTTVRYLVVDPCALILPVVPLPSFPTETA